MKLINRVRKFRELINVIGFITAEEGSLALVRASKRAPARAGESERQWDRDEALQKSVLLESQQSWQSVVAALSGVDNTFECLHCLQKNCPLCYSIWPLGCWQHADHIMKLCRHVLEEIPRKSFCLGPLEHQRISKLGTLALESLQLLIDLPLLLKQPCKLTLNVVDLERQDGDSALHLWVRGLRICGRT